MVDDYEFNLEDDDYDFDLDEDGRIDRNARAYEEIQELLNQQLAVVRPEIEARLARHGRLARAGGIDPHHLTNGLQQLLRDGVVEEMPGVTRGGREVSVYVLTNRSGRVSPTEDAAARKRLLQTRYLGWAEGSKRGPNVIGAGGELVVRTSLQAANASSPSYRIFNPDGREVNRLFNAPIAGGPLDAAAQLIIEGDETEEIVTVPMEVKNLRSWIYPRAEELFQLLDKAA